VSSISSSQPVLYGSELISTLIHTTQAGYWKSNSQKRPVICSRQRNTDKSPL